jgi:hypothetical protein
MSAARGPFHKTYIDGRLALAGINMRTPLKHWLDAAYVLILETPYDDVKKLESQLTTSDAQVDPEAARAEWGQTPQHQAMMGSLARGAVPGK